ncbi:Uncharacterised protein [uncultured Roseburia sp.]|uniref:Uncharacterized protein n=1 Tax=Brotonthovivens ammoniilytica TaxID=2981725 RepID=A0ABT2TJY7_9FIRM|nr:hypothetical protein [Brotonthovivens ammoniilytica]MCU6762532.1 hypothetical protein [Brotonthovivens ammoniilytica]SCI74913.1 Uncharacterised protein [uncultured Roseburia sp.]
MKKIISVIILCVTVLALAVMPAMASESQISPASTQNVHCGLTISGLKATSTCSVIVSGAEKTTATLYLEKYKSGKWKVMQSASKTTGNNTLSIKKSRLIVSGKFRAKVKVTTVKNGKKETHTYYSAVKSR